MTFLGLKQAVYRRVKLSDTPSTADATRIGQFINLWYRELMSMPGMDRFRDTTLTFATVANQKKYGLPAAVSKERSLFDQTNQRRILPKTLDYLRNVDPGLTAVSSFSENWIPLNGWGAVTQELTSTGVPLYAVSDNAGDTQKCFVETTRLGGVRAGTAVSGGTSLTGVSRVQLGALSDHIEVTKFYVATAATGTISLYDASSNGNLLAQITPGRTNAKYFMIQLWPTPGAIVTVSVDCQRFIEDLVNDTEEPLFHEDFHRVLVHLGAYEEWVNRDDSRALREYNPDPRGVKGHANKIISDLVHYCESDPDAIDVQRGPRGVPERISRLGGQFPAGT